MPSWRWLACAALAGLLGAGAWAGWLAQASSGESSLSITASPGLFPSFNRAVRDYAIRCTGAPVSVSVNAPPAFQVSVDGSALSSGSFASSLPLTPNQEFHFAVKVSGTTSQYNVRCLPPEFPQYSFTARQAAPYGLFTVDSLGRYTAIFDTNGVPVWWMRTPAGAYDSQVLSDGTYGFYDRGSGLDLIYSLAGQPLRSLTAAHGTTDLHELLLLSNGDYMIDANVPRSGVDLTPYGGPSNATVLDGEAEELAPDGHLVWSWNSGTVVLPSDTPSPWYQRQLPLGPPYDLFHLNAIQPDGGEVLISARHTDAVWGIDQASGSVRWKLGGTTRPESLTVVGDPQGSYPFGGQHDVRLMPDGTITVHDNNFGLSFVPRVVHFAIDESARTATYLDSFSDPGVASAFCCGSARRMSNGDWLVDWGANPLVAEYDASGNQLFALGLGKIFTYRAIPVPPTIGTDRLRAGMDAQFPRPTGGSPVGGGAVSARLTSSRLRTEVHVPVSLNGSASTASGGTVASYRWDFGDGHASSGAKVTHAYSRPGEYLVRLTVRSTSGAANTVARTLTVLAGRAQRPRPAFSVPRARLRTGETLALDASGSYVSSATLVSFRWRFGDGRSASGPMVTHRYSRPGSYRVRLTVTSSAGRSATLTRTVRVSG